MWYGTEQIYLFFYNELFQALKILYTQVVYLKRNCKVMVVTNDLLQIRQEHHISSGFYLLYMERKHFH